MFIIFSSCQVSDEVILTPSVMRVVKRPLNFRDQILPHSLRSVMSLILGVKWVTKIKVGTVIFVV